MPADAAQAVVSRQATPTGRRLPVFVVESAWILNSEDVLVLEEAA